VVFRGNFLATVLVAILGLGCGAGQARAQNPQLPAEGSEAAGGERSLLGPAPGALTGRPSSSAGGSEDLLGGRAGTSAPRVPLGITEPGRRAVGVPEQEVITAPPILPPGEIPLYGPLSNPGAPEDEGPPGGLTLELAIDRLLHANLALRARALELPQADADILTASLRANPLIFADSQLIPYGSFSQRRPGGPTQYDLNITYPLDVTHKRAARTLVACRARRVLEAQYQDAARLQIDNLYTAFTDILAARETNRFAEAARAGLSALLERTRGMYTKGVRTIADLGRIEALFEESEIGVMDAQESVRTARRNLAVLLNVPLAEADGLAIRASLRDTAPRPPSVDDLVRMALDARPDLAAYRLGISRAESEVRLAQANRYSDLYLLYQPYTYQNNAPFDRQSATSWALGVTVPLPLYNRNQGNIKRAVINVTQSKVEYQEREQAVASEVLRAAREYELTLAAVRRIEARLMPPATRARDDAYRLYIQGEEEAIVYLNAQREFNEASRVYRDMLVRHRRSMLSLNTATGLRLMP
jgi:cobalt-zinc-cadmium efflux system outer membrane protein